MIGPVSQPGPERGKRQPQAGRDWVNMYQDQISRAFYLDILNNPEKKAEVKEIEMQMNQEQRMRDLIPQLSPLFDPIQVRRTPISGADVWRVSSAENSRAIH